MKKLIFLTLFALFTFVAHGNNLHWSNKTQNEMTWNNAMNYCKNLNEDGHSDWRLPTISELRTLIQNCQATQTVGSCGVTDDCLSYSNCRNNACNGCSEDSTSGKHSRLGDGKIWLWSSSVLSDNSNYVWYVGFYHGGIGNYNKSHTNYVRCVRGGSNTANTEISHIKNKTSPTGNNLQWSEKSSHEMDWNAAINYCKNLNEDGYSDWRLPNIDELRTLIQNHSGTQTGGTCQISEKARKLAEGDRTNDCDGRNRSNFSKLGDTGWFWSSSVRSDDSYGAWWVVYFDDGGVLYDIKDHENYVRCVR